MTNENLRETLYTAFEKDGDAKAYVALAEQLKLDGDLHGAATAYDRAYGLAPADAEIQKSRQKLLDELSVTEHGIHFRYVPAGTFLMGSEDGDPDERPIHAVQVDHYWLSETPISWATYCEVMQYSPPPEGLPEPPEDFWDAFEDGDMHNYERETVTRKQRVQYCENETTRAIGYAYHEGDVDPNPQAPFQGVVPRTRPDLDWAYDQKPMICVLREDVEDFCFELQSDAIDYRLPTEAEWEKASRGGLIGAKYAWGDDAPSYENCDFDRFEEFSIRKPKTLPPNGYGLYGMCGGVWEWTNDWYDAQYYAENVGLNPKGPSNGEQYVLRGGSWADGAEAVTVSFRMSYEFGASPTIGFRLCRVEHRSECSRMDLKNNLYTAFEKDGDAKAYVALAEKLKSDGDLHGAATAYDRAYGLAPDDAEIQKSRQKLLDDVSVTEHGIHFRYIPAGTFLMGSEDGDPDEQPIHAVQLDYYWLSETPISWTSFCEVLRIDAPPIFPYEWRERRMKKLSPMKALTGDYWFSSLLADYRLRLQYCETETIAAIGSWQAHRPGSWREEAEAQGYRFYDHMPYPPRERPDEPMTYDVKPIICIDPKAVKAFCKAIKGDGVHYRLPTEAEWEKAARGGLIGAKYAWGDDAPSYENCDFDRFEEFSIRKPKTLPPNGYGLYGMCGGVWEWTSDWYDSEFYRRSAKRNPNGSRSGKEYVLRGGSWADSAEAVRVSFRMSSPHGGSPTIGFRLCRVEKA